MPPGFLAVLTQPLSLSLADFHAWYEEEHIPLRLNHLHAFLSGARYQAIDETPPGEPGWLAMYEIDDTRTFSAPSYTGLREKRSARETDVMRRLEVLVRWTGEDLGSWSREGAASTTGLKVGQPSGCVVTHVLDGLDAGAVKSWAEQVAAAGKTVKGFVATRLVKVLEGGQTRMGVAVAPDQAQYFVIHEFERQEGADTEGLRKILPSEMSGRVDKWRVWKLHKAYPCVAQGNAADAVVAAIEERSPP